MPHQHSTQLLIYFIHSNPLKLSSSPTLKSPNPILFLFSHFLFKEVKKKVKEVAR